MKKKIVVIVVSTLLTIGIFQGQSFFNQWQLHQRVEEVFLDDQDYHYFYDKMNDHEKEIYQRLYYVIHEHQESIDVKTCDIELLTDILIKLSYDHPEFYYVNINEFEYSQQQGSLIFYPHYDYTQQEIEYYHQKIKENTEELIYQINLVEDQILQIQMIYEYIADHVHYQMTHQTDQTLIGSLVQGNAVCAGYARAYQYLLNQIDIDCTYIVGKSTDNSLNQGVIEGYEGHAWVMIHLDDDYYYSDVTWADVEEGELQHTCYGYMLMSSDEMEKCYIPEVEYEKTNRVKTNYFIENGTYMESYDKEVFSHAVALAQSQGKHVAEIMCANDEVYQQVKNQLNHGYLGYDVLYENGCWNDQSRYSWNDYLRVIELFF